MPFKFDEIPVSPKLDQIVETSLNQLKKQKKAEARRKRWIRFGSAAAVFAAAAIFCVSNPAFAAQIPIVGSLFSGMEDDFPYAGDYSDRAEILTPPETLASAEESDNASEQKETAAVPADNPYSVTDGGLTLTASEIYSDGLSVFLSMQIHSEEPFGFMYEWDADTGELARDEAGNLIPSPAIVYTEGKAYIDSEEVSFDSTRLFVEQLDEHNFNGMIKTDLPASMFGTGEAHTMRVSLQHFVADFCDADGNIIMNDDNIGGAALQIDGAWELELPFTPDTGSLQIYKNPASSDAPYQVTDIYVSPYQVIACFIAGDNQWGEPDGGIACFDENGTLLEKGNQSSTFGFDAFSLNKRKPSELHFYVMEDWVISCKTRDEETAKERAVNTFTLPLSW